MESVSAVPEVQTAAPVNKVLRFDVHQRLQHLVMMTTFIILVATGMPLKFSGWGMSQWWIDFWGGIETTRTVHRIAGWTMLGDCLYHILYIGYGTLLRKRPFPYWMVPTPRDFRDFFQELRYFTGLAKTRPQYDRFNWREKFDYMAIFWGIPIIGISGLIMMYPVFWTKFLPGWIVPAALVAHGDEALLALLWIVIVHLVFNHLAPGVFPINTSIFSGKVPRERYRHEHSLEYERKFGSDIALEATPADPPPQGAAGEPLDAPETPPETPEVKGEENPEGRTR
ncbi:MAG: cytochrome b/b6 domain-containing protein [Chloroflexi bacterium]|nr:cytochrome b/b6 domain-containing protein [Chloroflexota bacterium]